MIDKKTVPALPLGEKLRFKNGRLYFGEESDAPGVALTTLTGSGSLPADNLDLPVLQACYGLIRDGILDLASRGEAPGPMFSVTVGLDAFLGMLGYAGSKDDEAKTQYAWDSIASYGKMCGLDGSGAAFSILSVVGISYDDSGRRTVEFMSGCVNKITIDALAG